MIERDKSRYESGDKSPHSKTLADARVGLGSGLGCQKVCIFILRQILKLRPYISQKKQNTLKTTG
jgi:hypothetical protein